MDIQLGRSIFHDKILLQLLYYIMYKDNMIYTFIRSIFRSSNYIMPVIANNHQ